MFQSRAGVCPPGSLLLVVLRRRRGGLSSAFVFFSNDPNRYRRRDAMPTSPRKYFSDQ